jgi:farnesyl-diphosphate farnesyltransferase
MAILTLRKINKRRDYTSGSDVKISRRSVKAIILVSNVTLSSNYLLRVLFDLTGRGLPMSRINP